MPPEVEAVFARYPDAVRRQLGGVRALIFSQAERLGVGPLTETLKWGEPAYLTEISRSGTTIRLGWNKKRPNDGAVLFNCRTSLIADIRETFGDLFVYEGHRALLLPVAVPVPVDALCLSIEWALTYKRRRTLV